MITHFQASLFHVSFITSEIMTSLSESIATLVGQLKSPQLYLILINAQVEITIYLNATEP